MYILSSNKIHIPIEEYRARLDDPVWGYTQDEKNHLNALYDNICDTSMTLRDAAALVNTWAHCYQELIPCRLWEVLWQAAVDQGVTYEKVRG